MQQLNLSSDSLSTTSFNLAACTFNVDIQDNTTEFNLSIQNDVVVNSDISDNNLILENNDYLNLRNKPTLDGVTIIGNIKERDPTVPEWAKADSKPKYTYKEVEALGEDEVDSLTLEELSLLWDTL